MSLQTEVELSPNWSALSPPEDEAPGVAAGSRVQTRRGEVLVESLAVGEDVLTPSGAFSKVKGLSVRRGLASFARPAVRIGQDAFGPMQPSRDVVVSLGQVVLITEGPATAESLLGLGLGLGRVSREQATRTPIVRVELDPPAAMMVDGLAVSGCGSSR